MSRHTSRFYVVCLFSFFCARSGVRPVPARSDPGTTYNNDVNGTRRQNACGIPERAPALVC